jgi:CBS domain-containing protein
MYYPRPPGSGWRSIMKLSDILKEKGRTVHTARHDESVSVAIQKLVANNIGALAILDQNNQLVGIFSERDILRLISKNADALAALKISDFMTANVVSGYPEDDSDASQSKMHTYRIRHLPVVNNDGALVGMISQGDLVKARLDQVEFHNTQMEGLVSGKYPA